MRNEGNEPELIIIVQDAGRGHLDYTRNPEKIQTNFVLLITSER